MEALEDAWRPPERVLRGEQPGRFVERAGGSVWVEWGVQGRERPTKPCNVL